MRNVMNVVVSLMLLLIVGCKVKETASFDLMSTSTQVGHVLVDSIFLKDSIVIREACDTVFFTKYHTVYKERLRRDTIIRNDTIYSERVVTVKEKGSSLTLWWLLIPLLAVLWKVGVFDLLRKLITKNTKE